MELHALDVVLLMPQAHYKPVRRCCGDLEHVRDRVTINDERVIARSNEWVRKSSEYTAVRVIDR